MAFDDLTDTQREMIVVLIEELQRGIYPTEFFAHHHFGKTWHFKLPKEGEFEEIGGSVNGVPDERIGVFGETDLHALAGEGYITLFQTDSGYYKVSLKSKAFQEYQSLKEPAPEIAEDSGHYHYGRKDRRKIVEHYRQERGEIQNKDNWARTNYTICGRTLLNYEREFPET